MGTIINAGAIIVATLLGVIFKKGLPEKIQKGVMVSLGLGLAALSLGWFLKDFFTLENNSITSSGDLLIIVSLVVGVMIGEWIDIDGRLNLWAENVEKNIIFLLLREGLLQQH